MSAVYVGMDVRVKSGDSRSSCSSETTTARFVMDDDEQVTEGVAIGRNAILVLIQVKKL